MDKYELQYNDYHNKLNKTMNNTKANQLRLKIKLNNAKIDVLDCEIALSEAILSTIGGGQEYDIVHELIKGLRNDISELIEEQLILTA